MNKIWVVMLCLSILFSIFNGSLYEISGSLIEACASCVALILSLAASCAFFSGLINIMRSIGWLETLGRLMRMPLRVLFPDITDNSEAKNAISVNFAANILGMGNAATPAGMQAIKAIASTPRSGRAAAMFLVINCSSIQLLPATVIAIRAQAGSAAPSDILLPGLIATIVSTAAGITALLIMQRIGGDKAYELDCGHIRSSHSDAVVSGHINRHVQRRAGIRRVH